MGKTLLLAKSSSGSVHKECLPRHSFFSKISFGESRKWRNFINGFGYCRLFLQCVMWRKSSFSSLVTPEFIKGLVRYQTFLFATIILTFAVVGIVLIEYKVKRPFTLRLSLITINLLLINSLTHIGQFSLRFLTCPV